MIDSPLLGRYTLNASQVISTYSDQTPAPFLVGFLSLARSRKMKIAVTVLVIALAGVSVFGQTPTLRVVTDDPNLPSELFYGNVKVKPLRVRPGTNPPQFVTIDDTDFFVQQQYVDFLNRMPDSSGFGFWNSNINQCNGNAACIDVARVNTSAAFYLSIEFQTTGYLVERMYKVAYGSPNGTSNFGPTHTIPVPIVRLSEFLPDTKQIGKNLIVGQPGWEAVLEANKQAFALDFAGRTRFTTAFASSTSPAAFVNALFVNAGVTPSAAELSTAIGEFGGAADISNATARSKALRDVAENSTLSSQEFNRAFVLMQYFGYLRRDPDNGNGDTDYSGFDFWLSKLNQFNGSFQNAEMVKSFIVSGEYKGRF
jgi:hypothetical protein